LPQFETKSEFEERVETPVQVIATPVPIALPENIVDETITFGNFICQNKSFCLNITVYQLQGGTMTAIDRASWFSI
jgi:hypothetical protein